VGADSGSGTREEAGGGLYPPYVRLVTIGAPALIKDTLASLTSREPARPEACLQAAGVWSAAA